jgi:hypothetical protein
MGVVVLVTPGFAALNLGLLLFIPSGDFWVEILYYYGFTTALDKRGAGLSMSGNICPYSGVMLNAVKHSFE